MHKLKTRLLIALIALTAYACSDALYLAEGGIGGTGVSSGPLNGFGSIFVNGIKFDTSQAQISIEGVSATEDELELGMIVTVAGEINDTQTQGSADKITFNYSLQAQISSLDLQQQTISAAGKIIHIDELTVFVGTSMSSLNSGDFIGVSGDSRANGDIAARYITQLASILTASPIAAGDATTTMENLSNAIEQADIDVQIVTLSGLISARPSDKTLVIQGKEITIDNNTIIINGTSADLTIDSAIDVSANLNASDNLTAKRIFIRRPASIHIEAAVDAINPDSASLVIAGINLSINASTLMQDSSSANVRRFSLRDLGVADKLIVYGRQEAGKITLTRLQRVDGLASTTLSGPIGDSIIQPRFELFGLTVSTTYLSSSNGYTDANANKISATAFFAQLSEGVAVKVTGTLNSGTLFADSATIIK